MTTPANRSPDEIAKRMETVDDTFGFQRQIFIQYLPYEYAEEHLKDDITAEEWDEERGAVEDPLNKAKDYVNFAAGKARKNRGNSASRSVAKFRAWLWLAGEDDLLRRFEAAEYHPYGRKKLKVLADEWGMDVTLT